MLCASRADHARERHNLHAHRLASLYEAFAPEVALRLARKLDPVHTPWHGSWLNMAEPELSVLTRQCLGQRIGRMERASSPSNGHTRATGGKQESTGNVAPPMRG